MRSRAVSVVTEVAALDRPLSYRLDEGVGPGEAGERVRVPLQGRSVRGWILGDAPEDPLTLRSVKAWLGYGPPASLLTLAEWIADRWAAPLARVLVSTSPSTLVRELVKPPRDAAASEPARRQWPAGPIHLGPTTDPLDVVLSAHEALRSRQGSLLVLVPTLARAERLVRRLRRRGLAVAGADDWALARAGWPVVVGSRGAALAPVPRLRGAVIIDADDDGFTSTASPTWDALSVLVERCERDACALWATSMMPSPVLRSLGPIHREPEMRHSWPRVDVVDRRERDPHEGALAAPARDAAYRALDSKEETAVVVILQRLGTGQLMACSRCGSLARCEVCQRAEHERDGMLSCEASHASRPAFCRQCGATKLRRVRSGVSTLARDVSAQLSQTVSEVTRAASSDDLARVVVGTEAVFSRVRRCGVVIFADFDQYLLAPRATSRREAISAVGRAARLVGSSREGRGSVVLQTRRGEDAVLRALGTLDFSEVFSADDRDARELGLPPYAHSAEVRGEAAGLVVAALSEEGFVVRSTSEGFRVSGPDALVMGRALRARAAGTGVRISIS